jgi:aspartate racemase
VKTLGIVGGIAPESTIDYYRQIVATYRERRGDGSYPAILIDSIDLKRMLELVSVQDLTGLTDYLLVAVRNLARAGAEVGLLASNTPHLVFDDLARQSPIPLISIVEATCDAARALGLTKVGLLGTRFTMQARFYPETFARHGMTVFVPEPEEQEYVHERYMGELVQAVFRPETREGVLAIVARMKARDGIEGVILGGTELPLLFREGAPPGIPVLDTTRIHVERAVAELLLG